MVTIVYSKQYCGGVLDGVVSTGNRLVLSSDSFKAWRELLDTVQRDSHGFGFLVITYDVLGY